MKRTLLLAMILGGISAPALAESDSEYVFRIDGYTIAEIRALNANCGSYEDVGYSNVYGNPNEYVKAYGELGWLSAKLDKVKSIPSSIRSEFNDNFAKSYETQYNLYYGIAQINYRFDLTKDYVADNNATMAATTAKMREAEADSRERIRYNTKKTLAEVEALLRSPLNGSGRGESNSYQDSGWSDYKSCETWWEYQSTHINGEYLRYL